MGNTLQILALRDFCFTVDKEASNQAYKITVKIEMYIKLFVAGVTWKTAILDI